MNSAVIAWARSEWRCRWGALVLIATLIGLGGGATLAAVAGARRTDTAFERLTLAAHNPTVGANGIGNGGDLIDLDPALLDELANIPGVIEARQFSFLGVAPVEYPNYFNVAIVADKGTRGLIKVVAGSAPPDLWSLGPDDVYANEAMSKQLGKGPGDTVEFASLDQHQWGASGGGEDIGEPAGPRFSVRIRALLRAPEDVSDAPDPIFIFPPSFWSRYRDRIGHCDCEVGAFTAASDTETVLQRMRQLYPDAVVERAEPFASRLADVTRLQRSALLAIALAGALAAIAVVFQSVLKALRVGSGEDGARRAMGMTKGDLVRGHLWFVVPAVGAGVVGAVVVAYLVSPLTPLGISRRAEPTPGLHWDALVLLGGVAVVAVTGLVVSLLAALIVTTVRTPRLAARRRRMWAVGPVSALARRLRVGSRAMATVGVVVAVAGLTAALTVDRSAHHLLATPRLYGADYDVVVEPDSSASVDVAESQLLIDGDVAAVARAWNRSAGDDDDVLFRGPLGKWEVSPSAVVASKGTLGPVIDRGRAPSAADEVAVGRDVLAAIGADVGDSITVGTGGAQFSIVGVVIEAGVDVAGESAVVSRAGLEGLVAEPLSSLYVRLRPGADRAAFDSRYREQYFAHSVVPPSEVGHVSQLAGLPMWVGALLAVLGVGLLIQAAVVGRRGGRRVVAVHRALGLTARQVVQAHAMNGALTAAVGGALGVAVGVVTGRAIAARLAHDVGAVADVVVPSSVAIALIAAALSAMGVAVIIGVATTRTTVAHVLRAE
jgi:hypothetical protein